MFFIYEAFNDLATCRLSEGAIPWTAVQLYAQVHGLDNDASSLLWKIIRAMDLAERQWTAENRQEAPGD